MDTVGPDDFSQTYEIGSPSASVGCVLFGPGKVILPL